MKKILKFLLFAVMCYLVSAFIEWDIAFIAKWSGIEIRVYILIVIACFLISDFINFRIFGEDTEEDKENVQTVHSAPEHRVQLVEDDDFDEIVKQSNANVCYDIEKMLEEYFEKREGEKERCL